VSRPRGVVLFLVLLAVTRGLFLVAGLDPAEERVIEIVDPAHLSARWPAGPERPLYDREELYTGTAAQAMRMGLELPYRFMPYGSGSLVFSRFARAIQEGFGTGYLALKLLPVLVTVLGGLFWLLTTRRWLGSRAALVFAALYVFAPTNFVRTALIAKGDHAEAMAWIGFVFYLATCSRFSPAAPAARRWAFAAGLAAGIGVFLSYSTVPITAGVALGGLWVSRLRPRAVWLAAVAGLAVGLLPWLGTLAETGGQALFLQGRPLGVGPGLVEAAGRLELLVTQGLFAGYDLPGGAGVRSAAAWLWLAGVVAAWVGLLGWLARPERRTVAILVLAGTLAHFAAFCFSAPDGSSRYLVAVYPLLFAAVAALASVRRWGAVAAGSLVAIGLLAQAGVVAGSRFTALQAPLQGTDWQRFGEGAGRKLAPGEVAALPPRIRPYFWTGFGRRVFEAIEPEHWSDVLAGVPPGDRESVWEGIGIAWVAWGSLGEAGVQLRELPDAERAAFRRGLVRYGAVAFAPLLTQEPDRLAPLLERFAPEDRPALETSLARVAATFEIHGIPALELPGGLVAPDAMAWGRGYAGYRGFGQSGPLAWEPSLDSGQAFAEGRAAAFARDLGTRSAAWILGPPGSGPGDLAAVLAAQTAGMAPEQAAAFYAAAGRAARRAWQEPGVLRGRAARARTWPWRDAIPAQYQPAFASGFDTN